MTVSNNDALNLRLDLADRLFPGFGFFGASDPFSLRVDLGADIQSVRIGIAAPRTDFLNIGEISVFGPADQEYDRSEIVSYIRMSSIYGAVDEQTCLERIIGGKLIHSEREEEPCLEIKFSRRLPVSYITIKSRPGYEVRSRFLYVGAYTNDISVAKSFFEVSSDTLKLEALGKVCTLAGVDLAQTNLEDLNATADLIRECVCKKIELAPPELELRELAYFLPVFTSQENISDFNCKIMAAIVLLYAGSRNYSPTKGLSSFRAILNSGIAFQRVQKEATRINCLWNPDQLGALVISTHGIHFSKLLVQKNDLLKGLRRIFAIFDEIGIPLMLAHGTLLGAVREGEFLEHDDDVDLLYVDGSHSETDMEERKLGLWADLERFGIKAGENAFGKHFKVYVQGVKFDVFPSWVSHNNAYLYLKGSEYRPIPLDLLTPVSSVKLYDDVFPAPANPEAYLTARYGPTWTIPDPFFGFPWKVN